MNTMSLITRLLLLIVMTVALGAVPANADKKAKKGAPDISYEKLEAQFTADELRDLADAARASGNKVYLAAILKGLTTYDKSRFDIRLELSEIYVGLKRYNEAVPVLKEASALIPSDEAPHRLLAVIYKEQGNDSLRGVHLSRAAFLAQRNWENQFNLALFHISKGRNAQAEKLLEKAMDLNSANAAAKFEYAKLMLDKGDNEAAFRKFDEALLIEPKNAQFLAYSAYAANITKRPSICSENLRAALSITPKNPTVNYLAGLILFNNGNVNAAEKALRESLKFAPNNVKALEALGDVLVANFKYKEASGHYLTVWENSGYSERVAYKLGKSLAAAGKFKEAKDFFEPIAARNPKNGEVFFRMVDIYCELGDIKQAGTAFERFAAHAAKSPAWFQLAKARIHEAKSEPDLAQAAYFTATALDSENPHISAGLGRIMLRNAEFDAAIGYFDEAVKGDPTNVNILINKAKALSAMGERDKAAEIYENIISRSPQSPELYLAVAALKEEQGSLKHAIQILDKGLAANSGDINILFALGRLYQATKQYERAISAYQASINRRTKLNANSVEALRLIGEIYYSKLVDEKKAKDYLKRYVKAGGKDSGVDDMLKKLSTKSRS